MPSKSAVAVLALLAFLAFEPLLPASFSAAQAGMPFFRRRQSDDDPKSTARLGGRTGAFPETGDVDSLVRTSAVLTYKNEKFQELYGTAGNRYIQYGMVNMMSADYTYGPKAGPLSIEIANMLTPTAAAGLFHHHRGGVLKNTGKAVDVGAEGVIDARRGNRNLYFYRSKQFVKIVYSGDAPVPPLIDVARAMDAKMPKDRDARPDGFDFVDIEGVNQDTVTLTPGFTFAYSFLPPSVTASAPGGGSPASDLFVITRNLDSEAAELFKGYSTYLRLNAEYYEEYKRGKQSYVKAVDPSQGRVLVTAYKHCLIIAARPDGYEKGEALIDRVMEKIDQRRSGGKASGNRASEVKGADADEQPRRRMRWNPFRRRSG